MYLLTLITSALRGNWLLALPPPPAGRAPAFVPAGLVDPVGVPPLWSGPVLLATWLPPLGSVDPGLRTSFSRIGPATAAATPTNTTNPKATTRATQPALPLLRRLGGRGDADASPSMSRKGWPEDAGAAAGGATATGASGTPAPGAGGATATAVDALGRAWNVRPQCLQRIGRLIHSGGTRSTCLQPGQPNWTTSDM